MSNMRFMWKNHWDDPNATLTASSEATGFDVENTQQIWKNRRWYSTGDTLEWLKFNFANIILNQGFEDWSGGYPDNWGYEEAGSSTINEETTEPDEGNSCCRLDIDASNSLAGVYQRFSLQPNVKYRITIRYMMSTTGKTAAWTLNSWGGDIYLDSDNTWQSTVQTNTIDNAIAWTSETIDFFAHPNYTQYVLTLKRQSATSSSIYFDALQTYPLINSFCLIGTNLTSNSTLMIQGNDSDSWTSPDFSEEALIISNKPVMHFFATTQSEPWWRIRLVDTDNPDTYISVGRIFLGYYFEPTRGYYQPVTKQYIDPSVKRYSTGGQVSINQKEKFIQAAYNFGSIANADLPYFKYVWDENGQSKPYFICESPASNPHESTYYVLNSSPWDISEMYHRSELVVNTEEMR